MCVGSYDNVLSHCVWLKKHCHLSEGFPFKWRVDAYTTARPQSK